MTQVVPVSKKEMEKQTGFKNALGYSIPKEDKILVRKRLSKEKKKEVLAHEEDHIKKGEEGPFLPFIGPLVGAAVGLFGASKAASSANKATAAQTAAGEREIDFARESRDLARGDVEPYRQAGYTALDALMSMTGLKGTGRGSVAPRGTVNASDYMGTPYAGPPSRLGLPSSDSDPANGNYLGGLDAGSGYGNFSGVGRRFASA